MLDNEALLLDVVVTILTSIAIVPIILKFEEKLIFNDYLRLLNEEIRQNVDRINELSRNLEDIRERRRGNSTWLPGIPSNKPSPGYINKYLNLNVYENFVNQRCWMYIIGSGSGGGVKGKLAEIYDSFNRYCDMVHIIECVVHNRQPAYALAGEYDDYIINITSQISQSRRRRTNELNRPPQPFELYLDEFFFQNLEGVRHAIINDHFPNLEHYSTNIHEMKESLWWCPNSIKMIIRRTLGENMRVLGRIVLPHGIMSVIVYGIFCVGLYVAFMGMKFIDEISNNGPLGFFSISIGFAMMVYSYSLHNSLNAKKSSNEIINHLMSIERLLRNRH